MNYERKKRIQKKRDERTEKINSQSNRRKLRQYSDSPTVLIAPEDYQHIFSANRLTKGDQKARKNGLKQVPSDSPTALIAPSDYDHIYSAGKKLKEPNNLRESKNVKKEKPIYPNAVRDNKNIDPFLIASYKSERIDENRFKQVDSQTPTALIGPIDYEHIYSASKLKKLKSKRIVKISSDTPTALIAPDDYELIYSAKKMHANKFHDVNNREGFKRISRKSPKISKRSIKAKNDFFAVKVDSDTPTTLIAPDDYEHIYTAAKIKKEKVRGTNKADLKVDSDTPTALIAPEDYEHIYASAKIKREKVRGTNKADLKVNSDTPTALIAPEDYEHIYASAKIKKEKVKSETKTALKVDSDTPTALIAPEDYEHIYASTKIKKEKVKGKNIVDLKIDSDTPTALIAPDDYEHIYTAAKLKKEKVKGETKTALKVDSDTPTALIAPDDYEHIYASAKIKKEKLKGRNQAAKKVDSDTPTALIAPEDYEHIYAAPKIKQIKLENLNKILVKVGSASNIKYDNLYLAKKHKLKTIAIDSDTPTALIAPTDYEHIYTAYKKKPHEKIGKKRLQNISKSMSEYYRNQSLNNLGNGKAKTYNYLPDGTNPQTRDRNLNAYDFKNFSFNSKVQNLQDLNEENSKDLAVLIKLLQKIELQNKIQRIGDQKLQDFTFARSDELLSKKQSFKKKVKTRSNRRRNKK